MNNEPSDTNSASDKLLTKLLPDRTLRKQLLQIVAASINEAHSLNPAGWSLTTARNSVNLNVGRMAALGIRPDSVIVALQAPNLTFIREKAAIETHSEEFLSLPGVNLYHCSHSNLLLLWEDIRESHSQAIRSASKGVKRTPYFMPHSPEFLENLGEQLGVALPRPKYENAPITWPQKERLLKLVRNRYPDWEGFRDPDFVSDEITYKKATIQKARELISKESLDRLILEGKYEVFVSRLDQLGKDNNLLYRAVPMSGDLGILYQEKLDKRGFCQAFFDLLYGEDDTIERFVRYLDWVDRNRLPSKWTFPTYFLFLCHPDKEMFVKPDVTRKCLEQLGFKLKLRGSPDIDEYATIRNVAHKLIESFSDLGARDMVDIQSLIWVCGGESGRAPGGDSAPLQVRTALRWKRVSPDSFDLLLENPDVLDLELVRSALEGTTERGEEHMNLNPIAQKGFGEWMSNPEKPLDSRAYALLSNWFLSREGENQTGEMVEAGRSFWDVLFLVRPPRRLTKTSPNYEILPERFDEWWDLMEKYQGEVPEFPSHPKEPPFAQITRRLIESNLYFPSEVVANYLLGLQAKRFVILTGISGTGKTKLATSVARHFRPLVEEARASNLPEDAIEVKAKPYMFKYRRIVLPVSILDQFSPSFFAGEYEDRVLAVSYPSGKAELHYWKDPERRVTVVSFAGQFWEWFRESVSVGSPFALRVPEVDKEEDGFLEFIQIKESVYRVPLENCQVVAVRPDWTDNRGLLGYYNPLTNQYSSTPFLELLLRARQEVVRAASEVREPHPFFVILDEMNLARVEHYFSDFLSCLESGEALHLHDDASLEEGQAEEAAIPRALKVPSNLFFTGTVNVDETTYMFSPKVLDRAFTIELNEVDLTQLGNEVDDSAANLLHLNYLPSELRPVSNPSSADWSRFGGLEEGQLLELVVELNDILADENRHFGYRVANEIARFVLLASEQAGTNTDTVWAALDLAILEKVLPKFHGTQQELEEVLTKLFEFAVKGSIPDPKLDRRVIEKEWGLEKGRLVRRVAAREADAEATLTAESDSQESPLTQADAPVLPRTSAKLFRMLRRLSRQGFTSFIE